MEIENKVEETTKHPYAKTLEAALATQKRMLGLLERKVQLIDSECERYSPLSKAMELKSESHNGRPLIHTHVSMPEMEYTDLQISKIKTEGEIDVLKRVIAEKENYYEQYMVQFEKDLKEVELRYKTTLDIAKKSQDPLVKKLLASVVWERIEGDDEAKIALYKQIKKYV